jgi:3-isopropylmalate/(R)-2-methylmalate dehydratase small subunit
MQSKLSGKTLKYGDSIDTDIIIAGKYMVKISTSEPNELGKHAMEAIDPQFPQKVKNAPIVVAGKNFGCGSSREQAPVALKGAGVSVILAESFGRIFFRNAINIGLPIVECENISSKVSEGDNLEVDLTTGEIRNITTGEMLRGGKLPDSIFEIIDSGGLIPYRKKELQESQGRK